jgi:hypothetical protein
MPVQETNQDLRAWKTREGIGLGSREEDVARGYGAPSHEWNVDSKTYRIVIRGFREGDKRPAIGSKRLSYSGDTENNYVAEFGIRQGKVSWIFLSQND